MRIEEIDVRRASETDLRALNDLINTLNAESWPDDAPHDFATFTTRLETAPPFEHTFRWWALRGERPIGYVRCGYRETDDNQHALYGYVGVVPEERRLGLGSALLERVVATARRLGKRTIFIDGDTQVPASDAFLEHLGGERGINLGVHTLHLARLDLALMQRWIVEGKGRAGAAYELLDWRDVIPEEHFGAFIELAHTMNSAPTEDLDIEDFVLTPEQMRHYEGARRARGQRRWTRVARHRESGALAGYTDLYWDPVDPDVLDQGDTAVDPAHRGHGLGRWLKAANLLGVLDDLPEAARVRTGNAGSNAPMLAINRAMGFALEKTITGWQFDSDRLAARLEGADPEQTDR